MRYDLETGKIEKFSIFILFFFGIFHVAKFLLYCKCWKMVTENWHKKENSYSSKCQSQGCQIEFWFPHNTCIFCKFLSQKSKTSDEITERSILCFLFPEHLGFFREFSLINIRQKKITFSFSEKQFAGAVLFKTLENFLFLRKNFKILLMSDPIFVDYNLDFS